MSPKSCRTIGFELTVTKPLTLTRNAVPGGMLTALTGATPPLLTQYCGSPLTPVVLLTGIVTVYDPIGVAMNAGWPGDSGVGAEGAGCVTC